MILKGLRFGMLLQLAIGPVCLLVFRTSSLVGVLSSATLILAIALVDACYIGLSWFGISSILSKPQVKFFVLMIGCFVLILFGLQTILDVFHFSILPSFSQNIVLSNKNLFIQGILLTASNPLTIVFWSGLFSTKMLENNWSKNQLFFFAIGCVMSTILFLSFVSFLGSVVGSFLPEMIISLLNVVIGLFLIFYAVHKLIKQYKI